ncbi:twin-arginine translocase TatA/TatE family subunit [Streptomyces sp. NBC_01310]|uniref:twin-arginine translocase TatA/TatE family subunit n=1 Tax=Streptomyces sp. NBC_01310 TaxID=2903820 RepID=UPI0035B65F5F|nr:twin-arginine translocase TatA/TatE family subunit [Streptomyces sp. NBC_01310]WSJ63753.1 twin-arginine translocase TatA/TatE family subunit [Streptomyces sp. NBC_01310]
MFFDIGPLELLTILVIAVVVLGPDKLPKAISQTSALLRKFRAFSESAQADLRHELGPDFADLRLHDLHPQALAKRAVTGIEDETGLRATMTASLGLDEPAGAGEVPDRGQDRGPDDGHNYRPELGFAHGTRALTKQSRV